MKKNFRSLVIALISFVAVGYFYNGFSYGHDLLTLILAGGVFAILAIFVKPILSMLSLPFNMLTFGLFSFLINVLMLFAITFVLPNFQVVGFDFPGATLSGFIVPSAHFTQIMSAVLASFLIGFLSSLLYWVFN